MKYTIQFLHKKINKQQKKHNYITHDVIPGSMIAQLVELRMPVDVRYT